MAQISIRRATSPGALTWFTRHAALTALTALFALSVGCGGSQNNKPAPPAKPPAAPPMVMASPPSATVSMYMLLPNVMRSAQRLDALLRNVTGENPPGTFAEGIENSINSIFSAEGGPLFDLNQPLAALLVEQDDDLEPDDILITFGVINQDSFLAAMPTPPRQEGDRFVLDAEFSPTGKIFIEFKDKRVIMYGLSDTHQTLGAELNALASTQLGERDFLAGMEVAHFVDRHRQQIMEGLRATEEMLTMLSGNMGGASNQTAAAFSMARVIVENTTRFEQTGQFSPEGMVFDGQMRFREGSVAERFLKEQPVANINAISALPTDSGISMTVTMDHTAADSALRDFSVATMSGSLPPHIIEDPAFQKAADELVSQLEPGMAMTMGAGGSDGQSEAALGMMNAFTSYAMVFRVKDGDAYRAAYRRMGAVYNTPAPPQAPPQDANPFMTLPNFVPKFTANAYTLGGAPVDRLVLTMDMGQNEGMEGFNPMAMMGMPDGIITDTTCIDNRCYSITGSNPRPLLTNLTRAGKADRPLPDELAAASERALASPMVFAFFSYDNIARMLGLSGVATQDPFAPPNPFARLKPNQGADASVSARQGVLLYRVNVPLKTR